MINLTISCASFRFKSKFSLSKRTFWHFCARSTKLRLELHDFQARNVFNCYREVLSFKRILLILEKTEFSEFRICLLHYREIACLAFRRINNDKMTAKDRRSFRFSRASFRKRSHAFAILLAVDFGFIKQTYPALTSQPDTRRFISTLLPPQDGFRLRLVVPILSRLSLIRFLLPPPPPWSPSASTRPMMSLRTRARCLEMSPRRCSSPSSLDEDVVCDDMTHDIWGDTRRRRSWLLQVLSRLGCGDFL